MSADSTYPSSEADPTLTLDMANMRAESCTVIRRPLEDVFEFADNPKNEHLWQPLTTQSEQVSEGPTQAGTKGRGSGRFLGKQVDATWEVTEYVPYEKVRFTIDADGLLFYVVWQFDRVDQGTGVRFAYDLVGDIPKVFGRLSKRVVLDIWGKQLQAELRNLKVLMEA